MQTVKASESRDRYGNTIPTSTRQRLLLALLPSWWWCSLPRLLLAEIGSLPHRMVVLARTRKDFLSGVCGNLMREDRKYAPACSDDMTELQKLHPWAELLDVRLAAEAWALGALAQRRMDSERSDSRQN
jgi:hypothetical protein